MLSIVGINRNCIDVLTAAKVFGTNWTILIKYIIYNLFNMGNNNFDIDLHRWLNVQVM